MSYASLINNLPESLRSSTGLAALASVGFHLLLLAVLPVLPLDSKALESQEQRTVGLVELTPDELSRLPQVSTSPVTLPPPIATPSSVLPPLPLPPPINLSPSSVPPAYNYPPVGTQPSILPPLPPPPAINLPAPGVPPAYNYPIRASLPPPQTIRVPSTAPYPNNRPFTPLFPPGKLSAPAPSQPYRIGQLPPPPTLPGSRNLPSNTGLQPAAPFSQPATSPSPIAQQNTNQPQNQKVAIANPQTTQSATSARPEKLPDRGREDLLALRERLRERSARKPAGSTSAATAQQNTAPQNTNQLITRLTETKPSATSARLEKLPERRREMPLAQQEELRQRRARNSSGFISTAVAQKNAQLEAYETRQNRVQQNHPTVETKPPIYRTLKRCQRQLDGGIAIVGVVVNPEGEIVSEPDFLHKQGAAGIEKAAKDYVREYPFPKTDSTINQHFHLQFKYDTGNCPERTLRQSVENTNTKQPQL